MNSFRRFGAKAFSICRSHLRRYRKAWVTGGIVTVLALYLFSCSAPASFSPTIIAIPRGTSAPEVAQILADAHQVRYPAVLRFLLRVSGSSDAIHAGVYRFASPESVFIVAYRLIAADYGIPPVRTTFPEGTTVREMAEQIADSFPLISKASFLEAANQYEGYLFPDTYIFPPDADASSIVRIMRANFTTKLAPYTNDIGASKLSVSDIIILASLIEKEARSVENKRMVAGILFNRLKAHMPLQVDAVFGYIKGRDTYSPSYADLTIDSPYNTYTHKGLPPGPIDNPGLKSIEAVLHPTPSSYLYYLTGNDGLMHYATTYAQHQANLKKYLQ